MQEKSNAIEKTPAQRLADELEADPLKEEIATRFWKCNEMSMAKAAEYACLAVDIMRRSNYESK